MTTVTSRHFKAHPSLVTHAEQEVAKLFRYYDGIVKAEVILSFEKKRNSEKIAEVNVSVYNNRLTGIGRSEDFFKSIDIAIAKLTAQVKKYKSKLRAKDRTEVRKIREKV
jgi:putative sigma-54 modulation protein